MDPFGILFGDAASALPWSDDPSAEFSALALNITLGEVTLLTLQIPDLAGALSLFGGSFLAFGEAGVLFGGGTATLAIAVEAAAPTDDYEMAALSFGYALGTTQPRTAVQVPIPYAWQFVGALLMLMIGACLPRRSPPSRAAAA